ncbi:MAG: aldo/keto reductase [Chloroflexi bacterium]|nr:aldo/keto reductase [Chloroflexota bacterium]
MDYRTLGRTGVQVSPICFGTMSFGGDADEAAAAAMFHRCREAGVNFFDCADVYAGGRSEEILGRLIADCRDDLVITSKTHFPTGQDVNARGSSRRHVMLAIEGSLRRLHTDRLDLYFIHGFDPKTPMEESLRALDDLVHQGKILYPGVSNWAAWQIAKALGISALKNLARFECIQPMYNLVKRQAEVEILPLAFAESMGVISYSPLGGGLLSGKFGRATQPESGRLVENKVYRTRYGEPAYYEIAEQFTGYAQNLGYHPATLAVAWVMSHPALTAPIIGARNVEQLAPSLAALDVKMSREWREEISALSSAPPPATDRSEERAGVFYQGTQAK